MNNKELLVYAIDARKNAYAPLSNYLVGAALLTKDNEVITGCNIEDKSGIGVTNCCAERVSIIKAVSEGKKDFVKMAVVGGHKDRGLELCLPCGVCRQYILNYNKDLKIVVLDNDKIIEYNILDLLPKAWYEEF